MLDPSKSLTNWGKYPVQIDKSAEAILRIAAEFESSDEEDLYKTDTVDEKAKKTGKDFLQPIASAIRNIFNRKKTEENTETDEEAEEAKIMKEL